jgi:hypothetical protein
MNNNEKMNQFTVNRYTSIKVNTNSCLGNKLLFFMFVIAKQRFEERKKKENESCLMFVFKFAC